MKTLVAIGFIFFLTQLYGQFSAFQEKQKVGIQYGSVQISKAKFDSISIEDPSVATAYRKDKIYYVRADGKVIARKKKGFAYPFKDGLAIVKRRSRKLYRQDFGAINDSGKLCINYTFNHFPNQYGVFLISHEDSYPRLMAPWKLIEYEPDSVHQSNDTLFVFDFTYKQVEFVNSRSKKRRYKSYHMPSMDIYSTTDGQLIAKDIYRIYHSAEYVVLENKEDFSQVFDEASQLVFEDYFDSLATYPTTFFCFHNHQKVQHLEVRKKTGELLKDSLVFVKNLDRERLIVLDDSLQYIMDRKGQRLSPLFTQLGEVSNGWRIVYNGYTYSYMNDNTYEMIGFNVPLIARKHSAGYRTDVGGVIRNRLGNFKKRFGNFGRALIGKKKKAIIRENPQTYYSGWIELLEKGFPMEHGHAVVCVNGYKRDSIYSDFVSAEGSSKRKYNIINFEGKLLNDQHYAQVKIVSNNRFLAKETFDWIILDSTGNKLSELEFDHFRPLNEQYILGAEHSFGPYAILDTNYNLLTKAVYKDVYLEDGKIKGKMSKYPHRIKEIKKLKFN